MVNVKLEGAVNDITPSQYDFIANVLQKLGFGGATAVIETLGEGGDGYMAAVKRIFVQKNGKIFKAIVKVAPTVETIRQTLDIGIAFHNEHMMYTEVLPKFAELEEKKGIPKSERLKFAKCYGSSIKNKNEVIVLEDLSDIGYVMLDKYKPLTDETVRQILKSLAKYHSSAFALKNLEPETYFGLERIMINLVKQENHINKTTAMSKMFEEDMLCLFEDGIYKKAFEGTVSKLNDLTKEVIETDNKNHLVIKHGDAWTNNFMFRMEDGRPAECYMIDYQLASDSNPASDILFMIFNSTDYESRSKYFHDWINYYHTEMKTHLSYFGLDINSIYPKDQLNSDLKRHAKASLAHISIMSFFLLRETTDVVKLKEGLDTKKEDFIKNALDEAKLSRADEKTKNRYKAKMQGLVDTYIELGFITV